MIEQGTKLRASRQPDLHFFVTLPLVYPERTTVKRSAVCEGLAGETMMYVHRFGHEKRWREESG